MSKPKLIIKPTITKSNLQLNQTACIKAIESALKALFSPERPSIRAITSRFRILSTTLRHAVKNNGLPNYRGPATILSTHEEQQLVGYCKNMQKLGFGLTRLGVNYCIMNIVKSNNHNHPFKNNGPGKAWWKRFIRDYPDLSFHPSELPFFKLKAEYSKACNKLHSESGELVTKHTFTKMFDHLAPSIYTERIDVLSSSQPTNQELLSNATVHYSSVSSQAVHYSSISSSQQSHSFTQASTTIENELLKTGITFLKNENKILKEKLETFKNPNICSLKLALKYPIS
ncbi:16342_t:CDS:2 [Cetraspora pellucida]|uniref:16342_t:CDS:1 n=1 Tax=Cetraspora pellucida TaxID=1433469 RepID=A0A9N8WJY1_9GLOM|nr:16342_t:CDS:2 [Cetraspora pellucida]